MVGVRNLGSAEGEERDRECDTQSKIIVVQVDKLVIDTNKEGGRTISTGGEGE